jgi:replication factor C subunit 1
MNFQDYLTSKRSGSDQIKLSSIPTTSKVMYLEDLPQKRPPSNILSQSPDRPPDLKSKNSKPAKSTSQEQQKDSKQPKKPKQVKEPAQGVTDLKKFIKSSSPSSKPDQTKPVQPQMMPIASDSEEEVDRSSSPKTFLVKPSELLSNYKKKPPAYKFQPKLPDNLKDVKKHGEQKPRGGARVLGTKVVKKQVKVVNGPLTNQTFVITGLLRGYDREELTELLRKFGAKVTGSVSGKTSCLIHGQKLEDGRHYSEGNKYKRAKELNTIIMDEAELEEMIEHLMGGRGDKGDGINKADGGEKSDKLVKQEDLAVETVIHFNTLWVEKYKPKQLKEIIGNVQAVEKLVKWLQDWESVIYGGLRKDIRPVRHGRFDAQLNVNAVAALISGPPGVGKTTAARLVSLGLNYKITELNASDARSRKAILEPLMSCSKSACLTENAQVVRSILIMDEVDGMCAGDRGGIGALVHIIKHTRIPIICICNDRMSPKMKSIANHSYDIRFVKPNKQQVTSRMMTILKKEGVSTELASVEQIVDASGCDVRQTLTILEMWARQSQVVTPAASKFGLKMMMKDPLSMIGHFDAASRLLNKNEMKKLRHREKIDLFFIDFDMIPLIIHENYLSAMTNEVNQLKRVSLAADSISFADTINLFMRRRKEWSLLAQYGQSSAIEPGIRSGNGMPFPRFPEWFGKFSMQKKNERMLREVRNITAGLISGDNESILRDYIPTLYKMIVSPLKKGNLDETVRIMHRYNINPEILKENLIQLQFGSTTYIEDFKSIASKDKLVTARMYNTLFKSSIEKIKKKREKEFREKLDPDLDDPDEIIGEESEESDLLIQVKPKTKKKKR